MSNLNNEGLIGFQSLLYYILIIEKKYRVDDTAKEMRISTDTLYRYVRGERIIPPDRIIDLINATKEIRFLQFFCDPTGYLAIPAIDTKPSSDGIRLKEIKLSIINGKTIEEIEKALKDGKVDRNEYKKAHQLLTGLRQIAVELDEILKNEVRG